MKNKTLIKWMVVGATVPASAFAQTTTANSTSTSTTDIGKVSATGVGKTASGDNTPSATGITRKDPGGGLIVQEDVPKSKSTVTADFIQKQSPSADVFQILKYTPGANTASGDAYGLNQGMIAVRGLQGSQMGFNFEGMPLVVVSNFSVFPGEWIDTENTDEVTLNQGTPDLASPNVHATGGVVDLFLHNPSHTAGGLFDVTYGVNDARREFLRLESGDIGATGLRAFISYSNIDVNHFRGDGEDKKQHVDAAIVKDWGGGSSTKLALTYSEIERDTYKNPTLAQYSKDRGFGSSSNYTSTYAEGGLNYYGLLKNPWRNLFVSMPSKFVLNSALRLSVTPYVSYGYGASGSAALLNEGAVGFGNTLNAVDLNRNGTTTDTNVLVYAPHIESTVREGATLKGEFNYGNHDIVAGAWFEHSQDHLYQPYSYTDGTNALDYAGTTNLIKLSNGQVIMGSNKNTIDDYGALFLGDTLSYLGDALKVSVGVKELWSRRVGNDLEPNPTPRTESVHMATLPTFAVSFKPAKRHQFFGSVTESYGVLPENSLYPAYSNGKISRAANPKQPGEQSISFELGYRYQGQYVTTSTTLFRYDFKNRQIASSICDPGCLSTPINGGRQMGEGVDFELGLQPIHNFRPYVSFEYLHTEIKDNIQAGTSALQTAGMSAVESPRMQAALAVDYDDGRFFGNAGIKYVGSQYATFTNDEKIPSYTTVDAALGVRFPSTAFLKKPEIRVNMLNLLDRHYLSGVYSATTNTNSARALDGSQVAGSAPTYLVGSGITAMVTFATAF